MFSLYNQSTPGGKKVGVLAQSMATLSMTRRTASLWRRCLTTSCPSLPTLLATGRPSLEMTVRAEGVPPAKGVHVQGDKRNPLLRPHLSILPHFPPVGTSHHYPHPWPPSLPGPGNQGSLERVNHREATNATGDGIIAKPVTYHPAPGHGALGLLG